MMTYLKKHEEMKWNDCMENNDDNQHLERNCHWPTLCLAHHYQHSCRLEEKPCNAAHYKTCTGMCNFVMYPYHRLATAHWRCHQRRRTTGRCRCWTQACSGAREGTCTAPLPGPRRVSELFPWEASPGLRGVGAQVCPVSGNRNLSWALTALH